MSAQGLLLVSSRCRFSVQLINDFRGRIPSFVRVMDVSDPEARKYVRAYSIESVPSMIYVNGDQRTKARIFVNYSEVRQVLMQLAGMVSPQPSPPQQQTTRAPQAKMNPYLERDGVDRNGVIPMDDGEPKKGGLCGFDGSCINPELNDLAESFDTPFSPSNSNDAAILAQASPSELPQTQFQPPAPHAPQEPPAASAAGRANSNATIDQDEMNKRIQELERVRTAYDQSIEKRNRQLFQLGMTMR